MAGQGGFDVEAVVPHQRQFQAGQFAAQEPVAEVLEDELHHGDGGLALLALGFGEVVAD